MEVVSTFKNIAGDIFSVEYLCQILLMFYDNENIFNNTELLTFCHIILGIYPLHVIVVS